MFFWEIDIIYGGSIILTAAPTKQPLKSKVWYTVAQNIEPLAPSSWLSGACYNIFLGCSTETVSVHLFSIMCRSLKNVLYFGVEDYLDFCFPY